MIDVIHISNENVEFLRTLALEIGNGHCVQILDGYGASEVANELLRIIGDEILYDEG